MKKTRSKGIVKLFSVGFNPINPYDILDTHRCLMKRT